jgi:hypothetical protein
MGASSLEGAALEERNVRTVFTRLLEKAATADSHS